MKIRHITYSKILISISAFVVIFILRFGLKYNFEPIGMLLFPSLLLFLYNRNGLKNDIIFSLIATIIVFTFWGHFNYTDIILSLSGGLIAFLCLTIIRFNVWKSRPSGNNHYPNAY